MYVSVALIGLRDLAARVVSFVQHGARGLGDGPHDVHSARSTDAWFRSAVLDTIAMRACKALRDRDRPLGGVQWSLASDAPLGQNDVRPVINAASGGGGVAYIAHARQLDAIDLASGEQPAVVVDARPRLCRLRVRGDGAGRRARAPARAGLETQRNVVRQSSMGLSRATERA